jgi:hypothetical protein
MRASKTLALAAALVAASAVAPAAAAAFDGFSAKPAHYDPSDPATRAYFKQRIKPGRRFTASAIVANNGATALHLRVYSVDGLTGVTSGAVYGNRGTRLRKAGRWLRPSVSSITIAPHGTRTVSFSARVPRGTTPGDHLAGLAFESKVPVTDTTHARFKVHEIYRVVIGVEMIVPGPAKPQIALTGTALQALPGTTAASVIVDLANRGGVVCKPRLTVGLRGAGRARSVSRQLDTILPGDAIPYPFAWPSALASGNYVVSVHATGCGRAASYSHVAHAGQRMTAANGRSAWVAAAPSNDSTPAWMLVAIALTGTLGGLGVASVYARRHRRLPISG